MKHSDSIKPTLLEKLLVNTFSPAEILVEAIGEYTFINHRGRSIKDIISSTYSSKVNYYKALLLSIDISEGLDKGTIQGYKSSPCGNICLFTSKVCRNYERI